MDAYPAVHLIEDVTRRTWWPYGMSAAGLTRLDSLWVPVAPEDEADLVERMGLAWSGMEWLVAATWWEAKAVDGAPGLSGRFQSFVSEVVAQATIEPSRERVCKTEWCVADSTSGSLHDFLSVIRRGRGKNGSLTLAVAREDRAKWSALSVSVLWRALLAVEASDFQDFQQKIAIDYLALAAESNLIPVFPLDYHPSGGYVLFGTVDRLRLLGQAISKVFIDDDDRAIAAIFAAGGGLAV